MIDLSALEYRINELERRLANVALIGTVSEADYAEARVRVQIGNITTAWLPWLTRRAGVAVDWWAPEIGEQVMVISPSGEPAQGVVMPALYSDAHPAPSADENIRRIDFGDGSFVEYDRSAHKLSVTVIEDESAEPKVSVTVQSGNAVVNASGDLTATADGKITVSAGGDASISAGGNVEVDGTKVNLNGNTMGGVVCQKHTCAFTGSPHPEASGTVKAGN